MQKSEFKKLIEKGETAREQKDYTAALVCFYEAMFDAEKREHWRDFVEALGHKIVVTKHRWWETKEEVVLAWMRRQVHLGLDTCKMKKLPGRYLAVFQLRAGDVFMAEENFKAAATWYGRAVKSLSGTPENAGYGEYLGHWGRALIFTKSRKRAKKILLRALELIRDDKDVRPFHRLILESAVLASLALFYKEEDSGKSKKLFAEALYMAKKLKKEHNMPMRLKQLQIMKKEYGL